MRKFFLTLVGMTSGFTTLRGEEFELFLLAGQSNMDGRGKSANLTDEQRKPSGRDIIYYRNPPKSTEGWQPLGPGYSVAPGYKGDLPSTTFGPELGFVAAMGKALPEKRFALIKGSKGGSSLRVDWNPGEAGKPETQGLRYRYFIETIAMARMALKKDGHSAKLRGLIWHQGESDSKASTKAHQERLARFMARIREDTGVADLPIVLGEVFDNGKRDKVRAAILQASEADSRAGFVSAQGTTTWDKGTHFDAKSQLLLGARYAEAILKFPEGNERPLLIEECSKIGPEFRSMPYLKLACELQMLGRDQAIGKLRNWSETGRYEHQVMILCRMLFEPGRGGVFRGPALGGPHLPGKTTSKDWPKVPIALVKGIPILLTRGYALFGRAETSHKYLVYCEEECRWSDFRFQEKTHKVISEVIDEWLEAQEWSVGLKDHERKFFQDQRRAN